MTNIENLTELLKEKLAKYPPILKRDYTPSSRNRNVANTFRIMQWNVLAKALCQPEPPARPIPPEVCNWPDLRLWRCLEEMTRYDCDIVCIEEADGYEQFKPYMQQLGYTSVFCPKTTSPCELYPADFVGPDGCAVFYKLDLFRIATLSCEKIYVNDEVQSQVFITLQLIHKQSGKMITVVCLHLKSSEKCAQMRQDQIEFILKSVKRHLKAQPEYIDNPVIFCGDFNGEPFEDFYRTITTDADLRLIDAFSITANGEKVPKNKTTLKSRGVDGLGGGEAANRAIDYIFYTPATLELINSLTLDIQDETVNKQGLPSFIYPSDHLSLVADFKIV